MKGKFSEPQGSKEQSSVRTMKEGLAQLKKEKPTSYADVSDEEVRSAELPRFPSHEVRVGSRKNSNKYESPKNKYETAPSGITIALLDDDQLTLNILSTLIKKKHSRIHVVPCLIKDQKDLENFKGRVEMGEFNAIITDHDMGDGCTGTQVINFVRDLEDGKLKDMPILLNSSDTLFDRDELEKKHVHIFEKPLKPTNIADFMAEIGHKYDKFQLKKPQGDDETLNSTAPSTRFL